MNFSTAVKQCLTQKYVTFSGRASRSEYWYFALFSACVYAIAAIVDGSSIVLQPEPQLQLVGILAYLAIVLPSVAVSVRRLHDLNKSGWWMLIAFIPLVGAIVMLIWTVTKGTSGDNRFGPDPLAQT